MHHRSSLGKPTKFQVEWDKQCLRLFGKKVVHKTSCSGYGMFLAVNPGRTGTTWKPAPTARLRPDDPARGVCLTRVAPCKGRVECKRSDSRMELAISAPLLAQTRTCICVSSSVTCVQKRTVSGQLVRIHCPNSQWSRRPLHAPFFILMAAPRCYTRNIAETAITRIIVSEAIGT